MRFPIILVSVLLFVLNPAEINGDHSYICTDVQCKDGDERFRDRLKLDHQTGSLTIMNITNTDSGEYTLKHINNFIREKIYNVTVRGISDDDIVDVSVTEGDPVTLYTYVHKHEQEVFKWYFNKTRIAEIDGDHSDNCTDVQCKNGDERFRDRLKLDHQTGSLTIMNITNTDSGEYTLKHINNFIREKIYNVSVRGFPEPDKKSVKEGESLTLGPDEKRNRSDEMRWYFNDTLITEITGDQSKICTDVQCDERFRDRLKLANQTGSLTIMNTRITDSGEYKLKISSISPRRINSGVIKNSFRVTVSEYNLVPLSNFKAELSKICKAPPTVSFSEPSAALDYNDYNAHQRSSFANTVQEISMEFQIQVCLQVL